MSNITKLLANDGFIMVNKHLIRELGLNAAVLIGELCREHEYWSNNGDLVEGSFYSTRENIRENTGLTDYAQREALDILKENEIVSVIKRGLPAVNYYKINEDNLNNMFLVSHDKSLRNRTTRDDENEEQDLTKSEPNKNNKRKDKEEKTNNYYNKKEEEFFGKIKSNKKRGNLYDKCYDQILEFTNNIGLIDALTEYLKIRLQMKDKPLYAGTWTGMLKKLAKMDNQIDVVNTSIERGWASFFEQKSYSKGKEKFGEDDNIKSVKGEFDSSGETF
jgi:hypothetical protein